MFIAHLPAGYILSRVFTRCRSRWIVYAALLGAIFPDLDLIYFYLWDNRQHHHHSYWIHFPIIWIGLMLVAGCWLLLKRNSVSALSAFVFSLSGFIHILLDSIVGDIQWLAPFSRKFYALATVRGGL